MDREGQERCFEEVMTEKEPGEREGEAAPGRGDGVCKGLPWGKS